MQWQAKAALQAVLSRVPAGPRIYRKLQDVYGSTRFDPDDQYVRKRNFLKRAKAEGQPVEDRIFLEIGTGWHPTLPILLSLQGACRIVTIDINPWMTEASLRETLAGLTAVSDRIAGDFEMDPVLCRTYLEELLEASCSGATPAEVLKRARIDYRLGVDACRTGFVSGEFDYVVSTNLLEHVPPDIIRGMIRESKRILKPTGAHMHHINPGDHFAAGSRITTANMVKYSRLQWRWIGGSGLAYHNRLRGVDFARLFESEGMEVFYRRELVDSEALEALRQRRLRPHPDFSGYTYEELATYVIDIYARPRERASTGDMAA